MIVGRGRAPVVARVFARLGKVRADGAAVRKRAVHLPPNEVDQQFAVRQPEERDAQDEDGEEGGEGSCVNAST